jgi:polyketide synthase PksN
VTPRASRATDDEEPRSVDPGRDTPPRQPRPQATDVKQMPMKPSPQPPQVDQGFYRSYEKFELLQKKLMRKRLETMGFAVADDSWHVAVAVRPLYRRWFDESARLLRGLGAAGETEEQLWAEWRACKFGEFAAAGLTHVVALVEETLTALPDILTGRTPITDVLFPNSSMERVENIYKNNAQSAYLNEVVAAAVLEAATVRGISILEVGAGTGATTATVLAALEPVQHNVLTYCYTDISQAFLIHAQKHYSRGNPFLTCQIFDVERSLEQQKIEPASYDFVIATNVLHATRNMRGTLQNLKRLLKPDGALLINEITRNTLFNHLTFGLTEGWWLPGDPELRISGSPLLSVENWDSLLRSEGLRHIEWPASRAMELGQQVILARSEPPVLEVAAPAPRASAATMATSGRATRTTNDVFTQDRLARQLSDTIREVLAGTLNVAEADIEGHMPFRDFGVDSILAGMLVQSLNDRCRTELRTSVLFDHPSLNQLCGHMLAEHGPHLAQVFGGHARSPQVAAPSVVEASHPDAPSGTPPAAATTRAVAALGAAAADSRIAVVGLSARFARSRSADELWTNLASGTELVKEVTRWPLAPRNARGNPQCTAGSLIEGIDEFDALFFNISGSEAACMEPQQRLFLQESWTAFEDAGYAGASIERARCGVYAGCVASDYGRLLERENDAPAQAFWGNTPSLVPARISYYLNLRGPAVAVDTACSSSLSAIHLACKALRDGDIDIALAGGVFVMCTPQFFDLCNRAEMVSPRGHCSAFDDRADGFVPGEGVGAIVLKRYDEALAARDNIYGVIVGVGTNQDGATNGITAPSAQSQELLIREVYDKHGIDARNIGYVEAHGTGTRLGDPIEFRALTRAFRQFTEGRQFCALGSIKTNLGHTATTAGIAGVLKVLLALKHRQIPPSLNFETGNQATDFEDSPFFVNTQLRDWPPGPDGKRTAAVSSFGFSGTNVHLVIEEAPVVEAMACGRPGHILAFSARSAEALKQQVSQFLDFAAEQPGALLGDISFTLLLGRRHFEHRLALVVSQLDEGLDVLRKWLKKGASSHAQAGHVLEKNRNQQPSLQRFGNQCIAACADDLPAGEYLDNLSTLAHLHAQGYDLDFEALFVRRPGTAVRALRRISLPTYPFAQDRYWVTGGRGESPALDQPAASASKPATEPPGWGMSPPGRPKGEYRSAQREGTPVSLFEPLKWVVLGASAADGGAGTAGGPDGAPRHVLLIDIDASGQDGPARFNALRRECSSLPGVSCEALTLPTPFPAPPTGDALQSVASLLVARVQSLLAERRNQQIRLQVLVAGDSDQGLLRCLHALMISTQMEQPKFLGQVIHLGAAPDFAAQLRHLLQEQCPFEASAISCDGAARSVRRWRVAEEGGVAGGRVLWKRAGVYLLTGGLGGIAQLLCRSMALQAPGATVVLCGRGALDERRQAKLAALRALELHVEYRACDVADAQAVSAMVSDIRATHGKVDGVIHCAGVVLDAYVLTKDLEQIGPVLDPKIKGAINLDAATADCALDCFLCFSSIVGVLGNAGQGDYAIANSFLGYFAEHRAGLVRQGARSGRSLAIDWPHWADGGMGVDAGHPSGPGDAVALHGAGRQPLLRVRRRPCKS